MMHDQSYRLKSDTNHRPKINEFSVFHRSQSWMLEATDLFWGVPLIYGTRKSTGIGIGPLIGNAIVLGYPLEKRPRSWRSWGSAGMPQL